MSDRARTEIQAFMAAVEDKIQKLVTEFADGGISREAFQAIYERYTGQITLAQEALNSGNLSSVYGARNTESTIAVRNAHASKALGLMIYHYNSGSILETLGGFDIPVVLVMPVLANFGKIVHENKFVESYVEKFGDHQWLMYGPGRHTAVVTLFYNEPSEQQINRVESLHRDFEKANRATLADSQFINRDALAYPFTVFVQPQRRTVS